MKPARGIDQVTSDEPRTIRELHPAVAQIVRHFSYDHLPGHLQPVSRRCHDVAIVMAAELDGPELTAGLRKLLEAKDCFVRAALDKPAATETA